MRAFLQYDWADPKTHLTETHFGAGIVLNGTHKNRPDDAVGVYFSLADFSDATGANDGGNAFFGNEGALEFFYKIQVTPFLIVRPDVQFIHNPSGSIDNVGANNDVMVSTIRVELTF